MSPSMQQLLTSLTAFLPAALTVAYCSSLHDEGFHELFEIQQRLNEADTKSQWSVINQNVQHRRDHWLVLKSTSLLLKLLLKKL